MRRFVVAGTAVAVLVLASAAVAASSGWSIQRTPNRKAAGTVLYGVSCGSTRACTAVGYDYIAPNPNVMVAERWNGTKWSIQRTRNPKGGSESLLEGVSCVSARVCTAVGSYSNGRATLTLAERWNGTRWSAERTPNPKGARHSELYGVSCTAADACTAAGYYLNRSDTALWTLAERWNGTKWSIQRTPNPTVDTRLLGVSCASARACTGVGEYYNGTTYFSLAERWNGKKWSIQRTPNPKGSLQPELAGVSCVSARACTAVGSSETTTATVTLAERWNGTKWSIQRTPNPKGAVRSELDGVSCTAARTCTATGDHSSASASATLAERLNGTKWSIQRTPNPKGASSIELDGVSCAAARLCTAVGQYYNGTATVTLAERWKGGV